MKRAQLTVPKCKTTGTENFEIVAKRETYGRRGEERRGEQRRLCTEKSFGDGEGLSPGWQHRRGSENRPL